MLSTWHNGESEIIAWTVRGGRHEEVDKPVVINDYTAHMGAVDQADHYWASYSFSRKTLRCWRKLFYWMLEVSGQFFYFVHARNATICNDAASVQEKAYRAISWKQQECLLQKVRKAKLWGWSREALNNTSFYCYFWQMSLQTLHGLQH